MTYQLFEKMGLAGFDLSILFLILAAAVLISWIIAIAALVKYTSLHKKYTKFMGGNDAKALESYLMDLVRLNEENEEKIRENEAEIARLISKQRLNFQKIGMNKYDAFHEMGGNLSFALAILDENNDGFILNCVHNIQSSYCYAKEVKGGTCSINLSEEEGVALQKALTSRNS